MGSAAGLLLRHADAGRIRRLAVHFDDPITAADHTGRSRGDPPASHPRRNGTAGRHAPVPRQPDGLSRLQAGTVSFIERPRRECGAEARPEGQADHLRDAAELNAEALTYTYSPSFRAYPTSHRRRRQATAVRSSSL